MLKPKALKKGDQVGIVSLSSGILGEVWNKHSLTLGIKRLESFGLTPVFMKNSLKGADYLRNHPEARAEDLKEAFLNSKIKGVICAIGGDDTYRLIPYLLDDKEFVAAVKKSPKLFTGYSDTTINHLMFYLLGMTTYYGPNFICDLAELDCEMLPYTKKAFQSYFGEEESLEITSSEIWYEERLDFSEEVVGISRTVHTEKHGYELLQGTENFRGRLLGGCLESLYDLLKGGRYVEEKEVCERYGLFPKLEEWKGKILFIETSEEKPTPERFERELLALKEKKIFSVVSGVLVGKPQDEVFYEEYKDILVKVIENKEVPVLYNVNFGHAHPKCVLPYGIETIVDYKNKKITFAEPLFSSK